MAINTAQLERNGLLLSVFGALGMAGLGIGFALLTESDAVMLDGFFSLIGAAVGMVAIRVAALVQQPDDEHFHFGYAAYEPMLNLAKGILIAFVTLFALLSAVIVIIDGGREIKGNLVVVYALIAAAGCLIIAAIQRGIARRTESPLVAVDSKNWLIDGLISGAVAVAFFVVVLLGDGPLAAFAPYADPAVVVLLSVLTAPIPISIIRTNWRQLLGKAPETEILEEAHRRVDRACESLSGFTPTLRILETGRTFYLQLYLIENPGTEPRTVEQLDEIRAAMYSKLTEGSSDIGVDIIFTREDRWVRRSVGEKPQEIAPSKGASSSGKVRG